MRLNLGAGGAPLAGHVNVDRVQLPGIDVVHDLDAGPWPFPDGVVTWIEAKDVFEHVSDPILFMTECWRVLVPMGCLRIRTPHYSSPDAFTDPTHRRHCTEYSFHYWIPGNVYYEQHNAAYGGVAFHLVSMQMDAGSMVVHLLKRSLTESLDVEVPA